MRETVEQTTDHNLQDHGQVTAGGLVSAEIQDPSLSLPLNRRGKKMKSSLSVASLNINGRGSSSESTHQKWNNIHFMIKDKRLGILAVQETHLTSTTRDMINNLYGKRILLIASEHPQNSNSAGIAFLINKDIVNVKDISHDVLIPGRAACLTINWQENETLTILNVYAPNAPSKNAEFWSSINNKLSAKRCVVHALLGDFNMVESSCDRSPPHDDDTNQVAALQRLLQTQLLIDGWRERFPDQTGFSFPVRPLATSKSRIDRIYVHHTLLAKSEGWNIAVSTVLTDHKLVSVQLSNANSPHLGKGRWSLNLVVLKNTTVMKRLREVGAQLQCELEKGERNEVSNPQIHYAVFKSKVRTILREASKRILPKISQRLATLELELDLLLNDPDIDKDEAKKLEAALLQDKLIQLQIERKTDLQTATTAHFAIKNETVSKFWINLNKAKRPRDIIYSLKQAEQIDGRDQYERRSDKMAELARDYHCNLQHVYEDADIPKEVATHQVLQEISTTLNKRNRANLNRTFSPQDVRTALQSTATGRASGLDGLPYEFWKAMALPSLSQDAIFDPFECLSTVYTDIQEHGLATGSTFAEGWLCPIYKQKGDRRDISNHRPITLLNSDYKLLTKVIATRLASTAPKLIHPNQAGFIPGRSILDQIRLSELMVTYAEATEEDGVIVALDQEKAYDKIDHAYLWKTLERFKIPAKTINLIKTLYSQAYTVVAINGELSSPFKVTRGVRQGDPMSCLLFDLAIEPLAAALRNSSLKGYKLPASRERLITTLFADDTTVYLNENDDYDELWNILKNWCAASTAKFNVSKTKIIPIGSPDFRARTVTTRTWNNTMTPIPLSPSEPEILPDGSPTRILGAKIGNNISHDKIWSPILAKVRDTLNLWSKGHPSLQGKKLIVQMFVGGQTQFLTAAHGMPITVADNITSMIRNFVWDKNRPKINLSTLADTIERGGIGLLDIYARNEAIELMWLKTYLSTAKDRPMWTLVADTLLASAASRSKGKVDTLAARNPFLQYWDVAARSKSIPASLTRMLNISKKYDLTLAPLRVTRRLRKAMPAWFHAGSTINARKIQNTPAAKCLRTKHNVHTVTDLLRVSKRSRSQRDHDKHYNYRGCPCSGCHEDLTQLGCKHPLSCQSTALRLLQALQPVWKTHQRRQQDFLSLTPNRKSNNLQAMRDNEEVLFDPSVTTGDSLGHLFRLFSTHNPEREPATRVPRGVQVGVDPTVVYLTVVSSTVHNIKTYGVGTHFGPLDDRNQALHLGPLPQSVTEAWLLGTIAIVQTTPPFQPLHVTGLPPHISCLICFKAKNKENFGWLNTPYKDTLILLLTCLRMRTATSTFSQKPLVTPSASHPGSCELAELAFTNPVYWRPETDLPNNLQLSGASVMSLTQSLAYKLIRDRSKKPIRTRMENNIARIKSQFTGISTARLWRATRNPVFSRSIQSFLYKATHSAYSLGTYWLHIPQRTHLADCPKCKVPESLEHILLDCDIVARPTVWTHAKFLLRRKGIDCPPLSFPLILGCGLLAVPKRPGATRLLRIAISEAAHLIWTLRCERRIRFQDEENCWHSPQEIINRWYLRLDKRLNLEKNMTKRRFGTKALDSRLVLKTWSGTLHDEHLYPDDWTSWKPRVLVGRGPPDSESGN